MNEQLAILISRLREGELSLNRFLKVDEKKAAFEPAWQNKLYGPESLDSYPRWGICGKDNLVLMDSDKIEMYEALSKVSPDTFEVTSPRRGIPAKYLIVCGKQVPNKTLHLNGEEEGAGEIRADNEYLVTCGTEITFKDLVTGEQRTGVYKITKNIPIARMEYDDFMKAVLPFLGKDSTQKITFKQMREGVPSGTRHAQGIKYATFLVGVQKFDSVTALHAMQDWNKLNLPPMEENDLIRMVENASGYVLANEKIYKPMPHVPFDLWCVNGVFNHPKLALDIIQNYSIHTSIETDDLYIFNEATGIYDKNGDVALRRIIDNCLGPESQQRRANEVIYLVHVRTKDKIEESSKVAVQNGLLDVVTGELSPFTPNEFVTAQLPITYDKTALSPEILKFWSEIADSDLKPQFEEIFGYPLLRELPIHKATVLLGEGANGKSTFLDLLTLFLGKDNVGHVTLQQVCEGKFELAELHGKLANIVDDLPGSALKAVGNFKTITGNAPILVQRKHKDPFSEWSTTKQFFGCNKLPKPSEDTIAYFRRFNIIPFNRFFIGKADDKEKLKKMTTPSELSGLLNLALAGLKRLRENGDYTGAKSIEETRQLYIKSSDSCKAFVEEKLEESDAPTDYITTDTAYQLYIVYCRESRLPKIESKPNLSQAIRQTFPNVEHTKVTGSKSWVWQYLKLKEGSQEKLC